MITHEEVFALVDDLEKELVRQSESKSDLRQGLTMAKRILDENIEVLRGGHSG